MLIQKHLVLKAAILLAGILAGNTAIAGKFPGLFGMYGGVSQSQASGFGIKEVRDGSVEPRSTISAGTGLVLGTHWLNRFSTEYRIISLEGFTASPAAIAPDQTRLALKELDGGSNDISDLRLNDVSILYYFREKGGIDHYSTRDRFSPFVRLGLANLSTDVSEFGLFTDGDDYLSVGIGVDFTVQRVGLRAEVNALHADYLFSTLSFVIGFD